MDWNRFNNEQVETLEEKAALPLCSCKAGRSLSASVIGATTTTEPKQEISSPEFGSPATAGKCFFLLQSIGEVLCNSKLDRSAEMLLMHPSSSLIRGQYGYCAGECMGWVGWLVGWFVVTLII